MSAPRNIFVVSKVTIPEDKEKSNFEEKKTMKSAEDSCRKGSKQDESCCTFLAAACKCKYRSSMLQFLVFGAVILVAVLLINVVFFFVNYHSLDKFQDIYMQKLQALEMKINKNYRNLQQILLTQGNLTFPFNVSF